jgi:hypothetical protein
LPSAHRIDRQSRDERALSGYGGEENSQAPQTTAQIIESVSKNADWDSGPESMIKRNLMYGNLEYAAEVALKCGRVAEAFLIAQAGGEQLIDEIQSRFFS